MDGYMYSSMGNILNVNIQRLRDNFNRNYQINQLIILIITYKVFSIHFWLHFTFNVSFKSLNDAYWSTPVFPECKFCDRETVPASAIGCKRIKIQWEKEENIFILLLVTFHTFHTNFWPKYHERGEQEVTQPECCSGCYLCIVLRQAAWWGFLPDSSRCVLTLARYLQSGRRRRHTFS